MKRLQLDKPISFSNLFLFTELLLCLMILGTTLLSMPAITSACFALTFIILLLFLLQTALQIPLTKQRIPLAVCLFLIIAMSFITTLAGAPSFMTFSYYKKYLIFISTLILIFICISIPVDKKKVDFIFAINLIMGFLYIAAYLFLPKTYFAGGLTFQFSNPNETAIWILNTWLFCFLAIFYYKKTSAKVCFVLLSVFLFYFILLTRARTTLITALIFIAISLFVWLKKRIKFGALFSTLLMSFPILFVAVYMWMVNSGAIKWFSFLTAEGKTLTSRYGVYRYALEHFAQHPLVGDYYGISEGTGVSQLHNTHVDILASFGIVVFALFLFYLIRAFMSAAKEAQTKFQTLGLTAFAVVIIMGFGEAALFSGSMGMYILSCSLLLVARYRGADEKQAEIGPASDLAEKRL